MKTAISLPDDIFSEAEKYARRAKLNRSQLYCAALAEYLARRSVDEITTTLNHVMEQLPDPISPFSQKAARRLLEQSEW